MRIFLIFGVLLGSTLAFVARRHQRPQREDTGRSMVRDLSAGAITYACLAPAAGGILIALVTAILTVDPPTFVLTLLALPWLYVYAFVPASLCGVVAGALRPARASWRACFTMAAVGGGYGFTFMLLFGPEDMRWENLGFPLFFGALPGVLSSFLCARLLYGRPGSKAPARDTPASA